MHTFPIFLISWDHPVTYNSLIWMKQQVRLCWHSIICKQTYLGCDRGWEGRNCKGPKTDPWGSPDVTGTWSDEIPSTTTDWHLSVKKDWIQDIICTGVPYCPSLYCSFKWLTKTKSLLKSSKMRSVPMARRLVSSPTSSMSWVTGPSLTESMLQHTKNVIFCQMNG